jgi:membrane protein YdbS with pleckstrin-like domain
MTNEAAPHSPDSALEPTDSAFEFQPLDPRVISLWRVTGAIGYGVLLLGLLLGVVILEVTRPELGLAVLSGWVALAVLCGWLLYWRPPRLYRSWGYRIDGRVIETRSGLLFQVTRLLPLSRLQHVDLQRGPIERGFGLASLVMHTAGTHEAHITIPGLDSNEAERLRDHLVAIGGDDAV